MLESRDALAPAHAEHRGTVTYYTSGDGGTFAHLIGVLLHDGPGGPATTAREARWQGGTLTGTPETTDRPD